MRTSRGARQFFRNTRSLGPWAWVSPGVFTVGILQRYTCQNGCTYGHNIRTSSLVADSAVVKIIVIAPRRSAAQAPFPRGTARLPNAHHPPITRSGAHRFSAPSTMASSRSSSHAGPANSFYSPTTLVPVANGGGSGTPAADTVLRTRLLLLGMRRCALLLPFPFLSRSPGVQG